jgi:mono/diheme cytochrome c family protein
MRWTRVAAAAAVLAASSATVFVMSCAQQAANQAASRTPEERIANGRKLSFAGGCQDCHTPGSFYGATDTTRTLSGSELGWTGPWGTSYPRNLTPDTATGIGSWTEEQIAIAIREGRRPDGSPLLPPMPWPMYGAGFTHEEALDIAAYLKSIPAVSHAMPAVVPPGQTPAGAALVIPPPPAWDAMNLPPPPGAASGDTAAGAPAH